MTIPDVLDRPTPIRLLILQPTPFCNLDCDYCYLPNRAATHRMSAEILHAAVDIVRRSGLIGEELNVVWHAGEPLVVPAEFYEEAFDAISVRVGDLPVNHAIQTNGTLITDQWCKLFKTRRVRVGVSLDGPAHIHDRHRFDRAKRPTHDRVMRGIDLLQANGVPFHVICVVTADAIDHPEALVQFFSDARIDRVGFNFEEQESVRRFSTLASLPSDRSVRTFLERVYRYNNALPEPLQIREFHGALSALMPRTSEEPLWGSNDQVRPFGIVSVDCDGNLSTFSPELLGASSPVHPTFTFGNVLRDELIDVLENSAFLEVATQIAEGVRMCARTCEYFKLCGGGAPSNKLYENHTFASTETLHCRNSIQLPIDIVLADLEHRFGIARDPAADAAAAP